MILPRYILVDNFFGSKVTNIAVSFMISVPKLPNLPILTIFESFCVFPIMIPDVEDNGNKNMEDKNIEGKNICKKYI